jgi:hypothetical protein
MDAAVSQAPQINETSATIETNAPRGDKSERLLVPDIYCFLATHVVNAIYSQGRRRTVRAGMSKIECDAFGHIGINVFTGEFD